MSIRQEHGRVVESRHQAGNRAARKHMAYDAVLRHVRPELGVEAQALVDRLIAYGETDPERPDWLPRPGGLWPESEALSADNPASRAPKGERAGGAREGE